MTFRTLRPARSVALLVTALAVLAALLVAPSSAVAAPEGDPRAEQAEAALSRVQELLADKPGKAADALSRHEAPDVTMAMRDLFLFKDALDGEDREDAERILARPTDNESGPSGEPKYTDPETSCSVRVCVHYVESDPLLGLISSDAVDPSDNNGNGVPDFVDAVRNALTRSHNKMRKFGYRAPLSDGTRGGNQKPDIYLGDVGSSMGVFGYAVPEGQQSGWGWGAWGYLVLDNDYEEFCGANSCTATQARKLMRATAAHEYFHAVQFGYDYAEDPWFMEATATWIEDEIFDGVNDNVNFLFAGPSALQTPRVPIDHQDANWYGNWIWFRYLSERFGRKVVLKAWRKADGYTGGGRTPPDKYSAKAVFKGVKAVTGKGKTYWNKEFAKFANANRRPKRFYDEARVNNYPNAPLTGGAVLTKSKRTKVRETKLSRLASATYRIKPGKGLRKGWKLRVVVDGNTAKQGGFAIATVNLKGGGLKRVNFNLGSNGRKAKTLPFGKAKVKWVEVTIVNASIRYDCPPSQGKDPDNVNTCDGQSKDNGRAQKLKVRAIR